LVSKMKLTDIKWGWEKDRPDARDFSAVKLVYTQLPTPPSYFVNPNQPIYNQKSHPACVGFASAGVKTDEEYIQHGQEYSFDGLDLYNQCKKVDGIPDTPGTYPRVALQILQQHGIKQSVLPCKKAQPNSFWQIAAYYRIDSDSTPEFIRQVIFQYGSILVGSLWYSNWMDVKDVFPVPDTMSGGHAYKLCGWSESPAGWFVTNSWGKLWGSNGVAIMPYDMFTQYVLLAGGDVWKLLDK
jgi:hypothetical protein